MSITQRPPIPSLIPESAPFTPEQRTWLNGLFAGLISLEESVTPLSSEQAAKLMPGLLDARRGSRRRRALARSGHAVARPHEARRRQAAAAADDGGDGAAGLRPVRL